MAAGFKIEFLRKLYQQGPLSASDFKLFAAVLRDKIMSEVKKPLSEKV